MLIFADDNLGDQEPWAVAITTLLGLLLAGCIVLIILQPQSDASLPFKVELVHSLTRSFGVKQCIACDQLLYACDQVLHACVQML